MAFNLKPSFKRVAMLSGVTLALAGPFAAAPAHAFFPIIIPLLAGGMIGASVAHDNDYWRERGYPPPPPGYYYGPPGYVPQPQERGDTYNYNRNENRNYNYNEQRQRQDEEQREAQEQAMRQGYFADEDDWHNRRHSEHERSHLHERDWRNLDRGHERDFDHDD